MSPLLVRAPGDAAGLLQLHAWCSQTAADLVGWVGLRSATKQAALSLQAGAAPAAASSA